MRPEQKYKSKRLCIRYYSETLIKGFFEAIPSKCLSCTSTKKPYKHPCFKHHFRVQATREIILHKLPHWWGKTNYSSK